MTIDNSNKIINFSFINIILKKLYDWIPIKKYKNGVIQDSRDEDNNFTLDITNTNEIALGQYNITDSNTILTIGIGDKFEKKNAIKINKNGEIYIITNLKSNNIESLQETLDKKGVTVCEHYKDMLPYINKQYLGKCFYLIQRSIYEGQIYNEGLYMVCISSNSNIILFKLGDSLKNELLNYYTKAEVDELIKNIIVDNPDITDIFYTKLEIDNLLLGIENRLEDVEEFVQEPILEEELNNLLK